MCVYVQAKGRHRVSFSITGHSYFSDEISLNLELTNMAMLAGQNALELLLYLPPSLTAPAFCVGAGIQIQVLIFA